jgi:hypothetical protein
MDLQGSDATTNLSMASKGGCDAAGVKKRALSVIRRQPIMNVRRRNRGMPGSDTQLM